MMIFKSAIHGAPNKSEQGFVLPYVLVIIAILAIIGTIAAERLQRSSNMVSRIQEQSDVNLAFMNAESEAVFTLMSAITIEGGFNLDQNALIKTDFGFVNSEGIPIAIDENEIPEPDFWSIRGGERRANAGNLPVRVEIWDTTGFISLNTAPLEIIAAVFKALGLTTQNAQTLSARLLDFRDSDTIRQFRGAERADYRLRQKSIPSNAPFRTYKELQAILGWSELSQGLDMIEFMNMTTLDQKTSLVRQAIAPSLVLNALGIDLETARNARQTSLDDIGSVGDIPTDGVRLKLQILRPSGGIEVRAIDITRQTGHLNKPFSRLWVYETTVLGDNKMGAKVPLDELKDVIKTPPIRP